jgi:FkbM family methyltransferase
LSLLRTLKFIVGHPLNRGRPVRAIARYVGWQIASRIKSEVVVDWIEGTKLAARNGMAGATGNIYCGLHEYEDMSFILHALRPGDLFIDVGANVGSYAVLASGVCGARTIAIEPDPITANHLARNIEINSLGNLVRIERTAVGEKTGEVRFTVGRDTMNQVAAEGDRDAQIVPIRRLDDILRSDEPAIMKIDIEGFEEQALSGAARTLAKPSLWAIEAETVTPRAEEILHAAGFEKFAFDPTRRNFRKSEVATGSNSLFVRNLAFVAERCMTAPARRYRGRAL